MATRKAASGQGAVFVPNPKLKLLEQMREVCRLKHFSLRTEQSYVAWVKRFLWFHKKQAGHWRHPRDLLGHKYVTTTQIYTHVMQKPGIGVRSPLDG